VIFGPKVKTCKKKRIIAKLPDNFPTYNLHIRAEQLRLFLLEDGTDVEKDGSTSNLISNADELFERIKINNFK